MNQIEKAFFNALRYAVVGKPLTREMFTSLTLDEWDAFYHLSRNQGVLAIIFEAIEQLRLDIPTQVKLKWAFGAVQIENRFDKQLKLANELCNEFCKHNIKPVVLKGFALSKYYPHPNHRECGDFDCYLLGRFEDGNIIAQNIGAKVQFDDYKHSHINYKGLIVENHKFCTAIRGSRTNKDFERFLQQLLSDNDYGITPLNNILAYSPSPTFNALFLLKHSMVHFLYEGIKIRHLLDWAHLISNERENINWDIVTYWCNRLNLTQFVSLLNTTINQYLGLDLPNSKNSRVDDVGRFIADMLYEDKSVYNSKYASIWHQRYAIAKNMISSRWKFHHIYKKSLLIELSKSSLSAIFEKHPKL